MKNRISADLFFSGYNNKKDQSIIFFPYILVHQDNFKNTHNFTLYQIPIKIIFPLDISYLIHKTRQF